MTEGRIPPEKRFKLILSVYLILIKDGKTLLLRRQNTGYEDGNYGLVAGHADGDERATAATCREVAEESGLIIKPEDLKFAHCMHRRQDDERIDLFFTTDKWEGEPNNMEPEKCDDLSWFPLDNLPPNTIPYIKQAIELSQKGVPYSEFGWPN
ncbi:MAG TPA: NUDIX domain-containing protein [Candidatus Saccharimonadales bacterium]|nr:NUDIX domain-containing protein [Candidatus Saccharimonadales bacterium]